MSTTSELTSSNLAAGPLTAAEVARIHAYWRAANYLSVGQIYLLDNPLLRAAPHDRARQASTARPLGHDAWAQLRLRAHEQSSSSATGSTRFTSPAPVTVGPDWSPTAISRAATPRRTRTSPRTPKGCAGCSVSSPSQAASPATWHPRRPVRSMRVASSATPSCTRSVPPSTTQTCSCAPWSATARRRPGRSPRAGIRTSSSTPRRTARCCRSCI